MSLRRALSSAALVLVGCRTLHEGRPPGSDPTAAYAALLAEAVQADGLVDYEVLRADPVPLEEYVGWLGQDPGELSREEAFARGINAYNAFTLLGVLENWPLDSVKSVKIGILPSFGAGFFAAQRFPYGGDTTSLEDLEHGHLRPDFQDARLHAAINCASVGCPPLSPELYEAARLEAQLDAAMGRMVATRVHLEETGRGETRVVFNEIFKWFEEDFLEWNGSASLCHYVADFDAAYRPLAEAGCPHRFAPYDWSLNQAGAGGGS